jgi:hypothetical protein
MKRNWILIVLGLLCSLSLRAEEKADSLLNWQKGGDLSFVFSQVSLKNWSAGGQNSMSGTFLFNSFANYRINKSAWDNSLTVGYGLTQQGSDNLIKTDDRILLASKYGYSAGNNWFYTGLFDFRTQMTTGYDDPPENTQVMSELLAPGYLQLSLGMDYKPNDNFTLYMSPVTLKTTIVLDETLSDAGAFGVEPGENYRSEYGASLKSVYKKDDIISKVNFFTRLDLFSNLAEDPQYIDVQWEGRLNFKFNNYLTAVFALNLLYDHDIKSTEEVNGEIIERGPKLQSKQLLGFGLNYEF